MVCLKTARPIFLQRIFWAACLVVAPAVACGAAPASQPASPVGIFYGPQAGYRSAATALHAQLTAADISCLLAELPCTGDKETTDKALASLLGAHPRLVVTVGLPATVLALAQGYRGPLVFCMIPNVLDAPFLADKPSSARAMSGVTTDIAPAEQIDWIVKVAPSVKNLGLLCSDRTRHTAEALAAAGQARQVTVTLVPAQKEAFGEALRTLGQKECEGVLMVPDASVYNSVNVRELLLWGLRQKKPVWTFSENIVKAGALAGQFSHPEALGRQTARRVQAILRGEKGEGVQLGYPDMVQTAVNERTAELIGLTLDEDALDNTTKRYGKN